MPFPELCGESVEYLERTSDAILALSNFRLFIRFKDSFVNVSLIISQTYFIQNVCSMIRQMYFSVKL